MGTMTASMGANFGGTTNPLSSLWVMMSAPIKRVDTPQLDAQTNSFPPSLVA